MALEHRGPCSEQGHLAGTSASGARACGLCRAIDQQLSELRSDKEEQREGKKRERGKGRKELKGNGVGVGQVYDTPPSLGPHQAASVALGAAPAPTPQLQ